MATSCWNLLLELVRNSRYATKSFHTWISILPRQPLFFLPSFPLPLQMEIYSPASLKKIQSQLENWRKRRRRFFRSNGIIFLQTRKHNPVNHRNRKRVMHSERTKEAKVSSNILPEWINSPPPYLSILSRFEEQPGLEISAVVDDPSDWNVPVTLIMNDIVCSIDKVNPSESMLSCRQRPPWNAIRTIDPSWPLDWIIAPLPAPAFILFARPSTLANDSRPADRDASSPGKMPPGIQDGTLPSEIVRTRRGRGKKKRKRNDNLLRTTTLVSSSASIPRGRDKNRVLFPSGDSERKFCLNLDGFIRWWKRKFDLGFD